MTKVKLLLLCASLCLSLPLYSATKVREGGSTPRKEARTANPKSPAIDSLGKSLHPLLADRVELKKRLSEEKKIREAQIKAELEKEALEFPAIDLYGEASWNKSVNPFSETTAHLPESYEIDLSDFAMPLDNSRVTSHYGYRERFGRNHYGTDFGLSIGDTVRAAFSGRVRISSYNSGGYGNFVVVRHPNGLETVYGHLSRSMVREGTIVRAGEAIALGGNTGRSTGPHLHFETRFMGIPIDPEVLIDFAVGVPRSDSYTFRRRQAHLGGYYAARPSSSSSSSSFASRSYKLNDAPEIKTYRIQKGDTLWSIAQKHNVSLEKLLAANGMTRNTKPQAGKSLRIPD